MKRLELWGAVLTVAYLSLMGWWLAHNWAAFICLKLNELGDFLAGTFGPIAFLWLVLGFLQQGRELRLSTNALKLQAEELKNSVEQQSEMARMQAVSLANQGRLLQPLFELKHIERYHWEGDFYDKFQLENSGGYCDCVAVLLIVKGVERFRYDLEPLNKGTIRTFSLDSFDERAEIHVQFRSIDDVQGIRVFDLEKWYGDSEGEEGFSAHQRPQGL